MRTKNNGDGRTVDARLTTTVARWLPRPLVLKLGAPRTPVGQLPAPDSACFAALAAPDAPRLPAVPTGVGDLPVVPAPDPDPPVAPFPLPLPVALDYTDPQLLVRCAERIRARTDRRTRGIR